MTKSILSILLCTILLFGCGCSEYLQESETISSGEILTPEYMAEISQQLTKDKTTAFVTSNEITASETDFNDTTDNHTTQSVEVSDQTDSVTISSENKQDDIVYWTEGGSVWHLTKECSALSRSKNIISGSQSDAIDAGKERVCKKCG